MGHMIRTIIVWAKNHKLELFLLAAIVLISGFFRLYHVGGWMYLGADEGRDALVVQQIVRDHQLVALGPAASYNSSEFHTGPLYYYLIAPFFLLTNMSPAGGAWAVALSNVLATVMLYIIGRAFFSWRAGLMASFWFATSFVMVYYGRWMWNPNFMPLFTLITVYGLYKLSVLNTEHRRYYYYFYGMFLMVGLTTQIHGSALFALPAIVFLFWLIFRRSIRWWRYFIGLGIIAVTNIPLILHDFRHQGANTKAFWHLITQSSSAQAMSIGERFSRTFSAWRDFWYEALLHSHGRVILFALIVLSVGWLLWKMTAMARRRKWNVAVVILGLWLFVPFASFLFYKEFIAFHYFSLVYPLPFLLLAGALDSLSKRAWYRVSITLLAVALGTVQMFYSIQILRALPRDAQRTVVYAVTLEEMRSAVTFIAHDSQGQAYDYRSLPAVKYDNGYAYLFSLEQDRPSLSPTPLHYVIVEGHKAPQPDIYPAGYLTGQETFGHVTVFKFTGVPLQ